MLPSTTLPLVLHIPHAGTRIPRETRAAFHSLSNVIAERNRLTDWYTDELFDLPGAAHCATPISRLVVDLERFAEDHQEPRAAVGQGVIYTRASTGERLRSTPDAKERARLLDSWYRPWHLKLELDVLSQLQTHGLALLIDAHSFPSQPLPNEDDHGRPRPDICFGTGPNTPDWLLDCALAWCRGHDLSTAVDFPYTGCLVPARYHGNLRVPAMMIEVNRSLYLQQASPEQRPRRSAQFWRTRALLTRLLLCLCERASNRLEGVARAA